MTEIVEKCVICFESLLNKRKASPDVCEHVFCLECLEKWSRHGTYCPVDRIKFKKIISLDDQATIQVKTRKKKKKDRTLYDVTTKCEKCGDTKSTNTLLLCDCCDLGYHCQCLVPPLRKVPSGQWFCPVCVAVEKKLKNNTGLSKEIESIVFDNINLERSPAEIESKPSTSHPRSNGEIRIESENSSCSTSESSSSENQTKKKSKTMWLEGSQFMSKSLCHDLDSGQSVPKGDFETSGNWSETISNLSWKRSSNRTIFASKTGSPDVMDSEEYPTSAESNDSYVRESFRRSTSKQRSYTVSVSSSKNAARVLRKSSRNKTAISYQEDGESSSGSLVGSFGYSVHVPAKGNSTATEQQAGDVLSPPPHLERFDSDEDGFVIDIRSPPKLRLENLSGPKNQLSSLSLKPGTSRDRDVILDKFERMNSVQDRESKVTDSPAEDVARLWSTASSSKFSVFQKKDDCLMSSRNNPHLNLAADDYKKNVGCGNKKPKSQPIVINQRPVDSISNPSHNFAARQVHCAIKAKMNLPNDLNKLEQEKWKMWHSRSLKRRKRLDKYRFPPASRTCSKEMRPRPTTSRVKYPSPETVVCKRWMFGDQVILEDLNKSPAKRNGSGKQSLPKSEFSLNPFQQSSQDAICTKQIVTSEYSLPRNILKNSKISRVPEDTFKGMFCPKDLKLLSIRKDGTMCLNWLKSKW